MTPAEHLAQAEAILAPLADGWQPSDDRQALATGTVALAHAVIAAAAELGVPHADTTGGGGPGGAQAEAG